MTKTRITLRLQHEPAFPDDKFKVAAGSPLPVRLALTPDSERPAILTGTDPVSVFLSCLEPPPLPPCPPACGVGGEHLYTLLRPTACGESSLRRKKASHHYAYLPTPIWGVGGERSETEGGGYIKWRPIFPKGAFLHLPFFIHHLPFLRGPLPPLSWSPSP